MASLRPIILQYPGTYGLNTLEDTRTDEETRFGGIVTNGVVGSDGKLTSREDFTLTTGSYSNTIQALYTWRQKNATEVILSAGAGNIYSGTTSLTSRLDYSSNSTTSNSWQFAALGSNVMIVQDGLDPYLMHEDFTSVGFSGATFSQPNVVIAAFGRLWAADDQTGGRRDVIYWSKLLDGHNWGSGDAGNIDLENAWPNGKDSITALAASGNRLMVFGRETILLYTIPASHDPASMSLAPEDIISHLGCVARDSVQVTDEGIFFLSDNGIYKIDRLAQTTALLTRAHISKLVNNDILTDLATQTNKTLIRSAYYSKEGWYVISFPTANVTYCVHTRKPVPDVDGALVITKWTNDSKPFHAFTVTSDDTWYSGGENGVHTFGGYTPDGASNAYNLIFAPQWLTYGDDTRLKHAKQMVAVLKAADGQTGTLEWVKDYKENVVTSQAFTCSTIEFSEDPGLGYLGVKMGGSFNVVKPTLTFPIDGDAVTLHQLQYYATPGAIRPIM